MGKGLQRTALPQANGTFDIGTTRPQQEQRMRRDR